MRKKILLINAVVIIFTTYSYSQMVKELHFSLFSETTSFPFGQYTPIHPGAELGATVWNKDYSNLSLSGSAYVGAYYHKKQENALFARVEFQPSYTIFQVVKIGVPIGGGYLHSIYPGDVYEQNAETGLFETTQHKSKSYLNANMGISLAYSGFEKFTPFFRHDFILDFPLGDYYMNAHSILKIGTSISIN